MPSPSLPIAENRQMSVVVPCYDLRDASLFRPDNPVTSKNSSARSVLLAVAVATAGVVPAFLTGGLAVQIRAEFGFGEGALGLGLLCSSPCPRSPRWPLGVWLSAWGLSWGCASPSW